MTLVEPTAELIVEIAGLNVEFPNKEGTVHAVRGLDLKRFRGEVVGVVGESGSGKSVTSLATMGLLPRNARIKGSIRVKGHEVLGAKERILMTLRGRKIDPAMIFQDPLTSLNPVYSVGWQIAEAVRAHQDLDKAGGDRTRDPSFSISVRHRRSRADSRTTPTPSPAACASAS